MPNAEPVRALYAAFAAGDMAAALATMADDIVWNEADNFLYADRNPYIGPQAVLTGVFARIGADWENFTAISDELIDGGDTIVSLGHYGGVSRAAGKQMRAQFAHVFRIRNGKIASFQQYTDTLGAARAMEA